MTNREKLNSECMYDLLCRMNKRLRENEGKDEEAESKACIMDCFMDSSKSEQRCFANCEKCIAAYLNERIE